MNLLITDFLIEMEYLFKLETVRHFNLLMPNNLFNANLISNQHFKQRNNFSVRITSKIYVLFIMKIHL